MNNISVQDRLRVAFIEKSLFVRWHSSELTSDEIDGCISRVINGDESKGFQYCDDSAEGGLDFNTV